MKIINETGYAKIDDAIAQFKTNSSYWLEKLTGLGKKKTFTYTDKSNLLVGIELWKFINEDHQIFIRIYRPWNRFSKAIGATTEGSGVILLNEYKINSISSLEYAGTIAHECAHLAGFNHGTGIFRNFNFADKNRSVPYAFGNLVSGESKFPFEV